MRTAYLDCFAGISGDMFLGALLDAGVPPAILHEAVATLDLGASLRINTVDRSGISSTKVDVLERERVAERPTSLDQQPPIIHQHNPRTEHQHKGAHFHADEASLAVSSEHSHSETHSHGRSLTVIHKLIAASNLADKVKASASEVFTLLGSSEAKIHNVPIDTIHFHEVGAVDAIVDIVCAAAGIDYLESNEQVTQWFCSPVNVGGGMVDCAHGRFPVPAPATADLLRGFPTYSANIQKELVTPTGAAILRHLNPTFGPQPPMRIEKIGYGAGTRNPQGFPNVLRLSISFSEQSAQTEEVIVLETSLDDLSPQILAHVTEQALALGALDVMATAVHMKKGRLGTLITILTDQAHASTLQRLLLRETTTLGIRIRHDKRLCLDRSHLPVQTSYGEIRMKLGARDGEILNVAPEFEDCRAAAARHNIPVKQVLQAATAAYQNTKSEPQSR